MIGDRERCLQAGMDDHITSKSTCYRLRCFEIMTVPPRTLTPERPHELHQQACWRKEDAAGEESRAQSVIVPNTIVVARLPVIPQSRDPCFCVLCSLHYYTVHVPPPSRCLCLTRHCLAYYLHVICTSVSRRRASHMLLLVLCLGLPSLWGPGFACSSYDSNRVLCSSFVSVRRHKVLYADPPSLKL